MSNFFTSSIGKKFIMSITGLFLILFLCVHLTVNLLLLVSPEAFNAGCEFMALPVIKVIEPILALGFIIHIIWASVLTLQNQKARPTKYALRNQSFTVSFISLQPFCWACTSLTDFGQLSKLSVSPTRFGGSAWNTSLISLLSYSALASASFHYIL